MQNLIRLTLVATATTFALGAESNRLPACFFCRWLLYAYVTLLQIDSSFLFLDGIEPFFGRQFSMWHSTKRCSSIFDLGPLTPKIYSPKFGKKIAYKSACMADRPEMFGPTRGFSGMADSMEPYKMLWGRLSLAWQRLCYIVGMHRIFDSYSVE